MKQNLGKKYKLRWNVFPEKTLKRMSEGIQINFILLILAG